MKITNLTTYMPATVDVDLSGEVHEIYLLINMLNGLVLVPDIDQYNLVKDQYDDFVELVLDQVNVSSQSSINIPRPPKAAMHHIQEVRESASHKVIEASQKEQ